MSYLIGIEIDNNHVAWMHSPEGKNKSRLNLTTLSDYQHTAVLNFYVKTDSRKLRLISETVSNIPPAKAGEPLITVESELVKRRMNYNIYLNNRFIRKSTVKIPKEAVKKDGSVLIPVSIAAAVILILFALFFLPVSPLSIFSSNSIFSAGRTRISASDTTARTLPAESERKTDDRKPAEPQTAEAETKEQDSSEYREATRQEPASTVKTEEQPVMTEAEAAEVPPAAPDPEPQESVTIVIDKQLTVNFLPDNADLTETARNKIIEFVKKLPTGDNTDLDMIRIDITGHCARFGTESGRVELSQARARNTREFLLSIWKVPTNVEIQGFGAARPVTLDKTMQYLNRRAEIHITGSVTEEPTD